MNREGRKGERRKRGEREIRKEEEKKKKKHFHNSTKTTSTIDHQTQSSSLAHKSSNAPTQKSIGPTTTSYLVFPFLFLTFESCPRNPLSRSEDLSYQQNQTKSQLLPFFFFFSTTITKKKKKRNPHTTTTPKQPHTPHTKSLSSRPSFGKKQNQKIQKATTFFFCNVIQDDVIINNL